MKIFVLLLCVSVSFSFQDPRKLLGLTEVVIKIEYYSNNNPSQGIPVNLTDSFKVAQTSFSPEKDTVFYIHGWIDEIKVGINIGQIVKYLLLSRRDLNVFLVDWTSVADNILYPIVVERVKTVGNMTGSLIWDLVENNGLSLERTMIIGSFMGAHVAGVAGYALNGRIGQILGLDPDGSWFKLTQPYNRLTKSSAKYVQVIHTCGDTLGLLDAIGHADYYPNGGGKQPMCDSDNGGQCSHMMAIHYYFESLLTGRFRAKKCANYISFKKRMCQNEGESWMGGMDLDRWASGSYYLDTNNHLPFSKN